VRDPLPRQRAEECRQTQNWIDRIDNGARRAIYGLIREQGATAMGFLVCSSDSDDLRAVCDRVLVLNDGHVVKELTGDDLEEGRLLSAMIGRREGGARGE